MLSRAFAQVARSPGTLRTPGIAFSSSPSSSRTRIARAAPTTTTTTIWLRGLADNKKPSKPPPRSNLNQSQSQSQSPSQSQCQPQPTQQQEQEQRVPLSQPPLLPLLPRAAASSSSSTSPGERVWVLAGRVLVSASSTGIGVGPVLSCGEDEGEKRYHGSRPS